MKTRLIAFHGKKKSGKTFCCSLLRELLGAENIVEINFADALKQEIATGAEIPLEYIEKNKDNFRLILQGWGTDFRRKLCDKDYWVKRWEETFCIAINQSATTIIVACDVRFPNELEIIHTLGGLVINVVAVNAPIAIADTHESEKPLDGCDWVLKNDFLNARVTKGQLRYLTQNY